MMKNKANNIFRIPCNTIEEFYKNWVNLLTPIHQLTNKNKEILVAFLVLRHELSKSISDDTLLDEVLMNESSKAKIKARCNLKGNYLQVALFTLCKNNVIIKSLSEDDIHKYKYRLNPRILPDMGTTDSKVILQFNFELKCNQNTTEQ